MSTTRPFPDPPYRRPDWSDLPAEDRTRLNQEWRFDTAMWYAEDMGRRLVRERPGLDAWGDDESTWPLPFCAECAAGGSTDGMPVRGMDSHGDCAEDGEPVYWTLPR